MTTPPSLIETMRLEQGRVALWPGHRARLLASAAALAYPLDPAALDARVSEGIRAATRDAPPDGPGTAWRLRLLLAADGGISLTAAPLPDTPVPVRLAIAADVLRGPSTDAAAGRPVPTPTDARFPDAFWRRHKTTHRPWFAAAQDWLQARPDHFDLVFGDASGRLCEGSRCNLYVRDLQGRWLTPPADGGLLPGVQRQWLLDQGLVREADLSLNDLRAAPALRVSNALRGWLDARLD
ncbi:aminotransferase class IV [uncultured Castellaniella sp.]|uniref:aminotransferase class IV n=1 Tax=uncultured Castellaniella sp. TaxID=647907 RepID=UPI0026276AB7|nr:aminotransferase class IV [uncultured Castellaniella sp.]